MIHLAQDITQWRAVVNTEMNLWLPKKKNRVNILRSWRKYGIEVLVINQRNSLTLVLW